ncbi:MAG: hypothetical protein IT323_01335 [Anaerolineae bacterium]|nr:hypothetical protein [Anaerolineae bacterium]
MFRIRIALAMLLIFAVAGGVRPFSASAQGQDATCAPPMRGIRTDALGFAMTGKHWVGVREFTIADAERPLPVTAWYPAMNRDCTETRIVYENDARIQEHPVLRGMFPRAGNAIPDAGPDRGDGPYPLVVFSHALYSQRWQSPWLAEHLASYGYVVLATDHEDHARMDSMDYERSVFSRPKDVSRLIDYAATLTAADGALAGLIDLEKVAAVGHDAWGALGPLLLAGARLDLEPLRSWCADHPAYVCIATLVQPLEKQAAERGYPREGLWPSMADVRLDAVVSLNGWSGFTGDAGLQSVTVPVLAIETSEDADPGDEYTTRSIYDAVGSQAKALVVVGGASNSIFFAACTGEQPMNISDFMGCSDQVWDMDRAHDVTDFYVAAFLQAALKGEMPGRRVLRTGVDLFRNVTVESTF